MEQNAEKKETTKGEGIYARMRRESMIQSKFKENHLRRFETRSIKRSETTPYVVDTNNNRLGTAYL